MEVASSQIVGRDAELASIRSFLEEISDGPRTLLMKGEAGIGKTTLWRTAISAAAGHGYTVLNSNAAESEAKLAFTGVGDLLDEGLDHVLPQLPDPQRRALEIALLRADAAGSPPDQRAVSLAVLSALRSLASSTPVLVAVDDVHWLDLPSARVLSFAIRRLRDEPVGVMTTLRSGWDDPLGLDRTLPVDVLRRLGIGPLGEAEVRGLLWERIGTDFSRPIVRKILEGRP